MFSKILSFAVIGMSIALAGLYASGSQNADALTLTHVDSSFDPAWPSRIPTVLNADLDSIASGVAATVGCTGASGVSCTSNGSITNPVLTIGINPASSITAASFIGAGTGLTGTANSLTVGNATSAVAATNIVGGTSSQAVIQTAPNTTGFLAYGAFPPLANTLSQRDVNNNIYANSFISGFTTTASSATTITLTEASASVQNITGTSTQLIILPNATTLDVGWSVSIDNSSTAAITVQTNGGAQLNGLIGSNNYVTYQLLNNGTSAGTWNVIFAVPSVATGVLVDAGGVLSFSQSPTFATVTATNYSFTKTLLSATTPTIASGFGTSPSIVASNGTAAFTLNIGTGGTASSGVVTMPAATTGWACNVDPTGAPQAGAEIFSAPTSTTSITITNYTASTGVTLAWPASTVISVICVGY